MSIKYGRSMISMNEGKTAIFVDINEMAVSLRVIGGGIEHGQNVYLIVKKDGTKRYINMGQAEKRALSDKANIIKDGERLIGAALGRISENGAPLAGTFEGYIENEREKNNNAEPKNEKTVLWILLQHHPRIFGFSPGRLWGLCFPEPGKTQHRSGL